MNELNVKKDNFDQEVLKSEVPVLVDFWAEWCGPCKIVGPIVAEIAQEYEGKAKIVKVNVDEEPELARQFGIMSIPTMKFFKAGQPVGDIVGAAPKTAIEAELNKHLM